MRSEDGEAGAGPGPGATQRGFPEEGNLPWTLAGLFPDLVLEQFTRGRQGIFSTARIPPRATALLRACHRTYVLRASQSVWIPDARQVLLWGDPLPHLPLGRSSPLDPQPLRPGSSPRPPPQRPHPAPRPRSPRFPPTSIPHTWPAPRFRPSQPHPSWPRYLGLSKLHPLRRSAALFCRRSAAASPPSSCSIAPGGGRGLGRARVGSGFGGPRRASRLTRRSPRPAPRASARPRPRPCPAPHFSPAYSLPLRRVQTPP